MSRARFRVFVIIILFRIGGLLNIENPLASLSRISLKVVWSFRGMFLPSLLKVQGMSKV